MEGKKIPKEINYWKRTLRKLTGFIAVFYIFLYLDYYLFNHINYYSNYILFCIKIKKKFIIKN